MIKQKTFFALVFFLILFLPLGCLNSDTPARGTIAGTITDADGKPLSGVTVLAGDKTAVSDINGGFQIADLKADFITITAQRSGYETQSYSLEIYAGQLRSGIDFVLAAQGSLYNVSIADITSTGAVITFSTRNLSSAYVQYGLSTLYGSTLQSTASGSLNHRIAIASLTPATTYHVLAVARDTLGNTLKSPDKTFTTLYTRRGDAPSGLTAAKNPGSENVLLTWSEDTGTDFAGYRVYRAESRTAAFTQLHTLPITDNLYVDTTLTPGEKGFYVVTRLSGTGEESPTSEIVEFLLPGQTRKSLVWTPEQGTYSLTGDLFIRAEDSLTIDPGVSVRIASQDSANLSDSDSTKIEIRVDGALYIEATASDPVSFTSDAPSPQPGDWTGLVFSSTANLNVSLLSGVNLSFAETGVKGATGIPPIMYSRFSQCQAAGVAFRLARNDAYVQNSQFHQCTVGVGVASCTSSRVTIASNTFLHCPRGIVSLGNSDSQIQFNTVQYWSIAGIDVGNGTLSAVKQNQLAPCGAGTGIICRNLDEIRRNTMHGQTGIEIAGKAETRLLSNLILAEKVKAGIGIFYNGSAAYTAASHTIIANVIWDQDVEALKHRNSSGNAITPAITSYLKDPVLAGGDPFGVASLTFNYQPKTTSPLRRLGYGGEDIGAYDIP